MFETVLQACVNCLLTNFSFSPNDSPLKSLKDVFLFQLKSSFSSWDIHFFLHLFLSVHHCFRASFKKNPKVYDLINCLNRIELITHFVWYLEKEKSSDIETLSIDRVLNKEHFYGKKHAEKVHQKLVPDPSFILVNNPNQPLLARNSFKNKIFWNRIIRSVNK